MPTTTTEFQEARALVVDGNPQSRSILASQLREIGIGTVVQCGKLADARSKLEISSFDIVLCEQYFEREDVTGQDLLDDLRRNQLLPFHTVLLIVTAEATYTKVAEAAESALDGYLLKPHTANGLSSRISQARERKLSLKEIFTAIEQQQLEEACALCAQRFAERGPQWLYAARMGAELMLRIGQLGEAQQLYEAVVEADGAPWAKLGVARVQMKAGQAKQAEATLKALIESDPGYSDAYDMMGRAQFELGNFQNALTTFGLATKLTPGSVHRLLRHGMMAYHAGDRDEGVELLDRATLIGLDSKLYDPQALVLLSFAWLDNNDRRSLLRCTEQLQHLDMRQPGTPRLQRMVDLVQTLLALQEQRAAYALDEARRLSKMVREPGFDFESAGNLLALMTRLARRSIQLYEVHAAVEAMGQRFCTSRAMTELLVCTAGGREEYAQRIREAHAEIIKHAEQAISMSLNGEPQHAVEALLEHGERTLNAKLIESAYLVLQRHAGSISDEAALTGRVQKLRELYRTTDIHAGLGEQAHTGRAAGGVALPGAYKAPSNEGLLAKVSNI